MSEPNINTRKIPSQTYAVNPCMIPDHQIRAKDHNIARFGQNCPFHWSRLRYTPKRKWLYLTHIGVHIVDTLNDIFCCKDRTLWIKVTGSKIKILGIEEDIKTLKIILSNNILMGQFFTMLLPLQLYLTNHMASKGL